MRKHENECVGCPPGVGCLGSACPNRDVLHVSCDACGDEDDEMYSYDGQDYCGACLISLLVESGVVETIDLDGM